MNKYTAFYYCGTDYQLGNIVEVCTYDNKKYIGEIRDICDYDDHYHSAPVMSMLIKTRSDYVEVDDWQITDMRYIK